MSLTVDGALAAVRRAKAEEAKARENAERASQAYIEANQEFRAADLNLQEAQRVLLEVVSEEEIP